MSYYDELRFPIIRQPGSNLIGPIRKLAEAFAIEGGELKELWVSRVIYDRLTAEITDIDRFSRRDEEKWSNGLIVINTQCGKIKIRKADED